MWDAYEQRTATVRKTTHDTHDACYISMLLYIAKRLGVLFQFGYRVDPLDGSSFEFGQIPGSAFDFADACIQSSRRFVMGLVTFYWTRH